MYNPYDTKANTDVTLQPSGRGCALSHLMQSETVSCSCNRWWLKCTSSFQSLIASIQSVDCFISILLVHQWTLIDAIWIEFQSVIALIQSVDCIISICHCINSICWLHHFIIEVHQFIIEIQSDLATAILFREKSLISESYYFWELNGVTLETHHR